MLSIIIVENNEGITFIHKMLEQASLLKQDKEVIFVSNVSFQEFYDKYQIENYSKRFPVSVIGDIKNAGAGRSVGGRMASGDDLLFMDAHVCFDQKNIDRLLMTLNAHHDSIVAPGLQVIEFPSCKVSGGIGYGVVFRFKDTPFEWVWLPAESLTQEYKVPFVCSCQFSMKKALFNILNSHGGFIQPKQGISFEEEKSMRLLRLGYPTYVEPRATFGHYFKGIPGHKNQEDSASKGWFTGRAAALYVNVFDQQLWDYLDNMLKEKWGSEWDNALKYAKENYTWLRNIMKPYANRIDERWFFRTE